MSLWKWSQTAATNATADSSINWAEGQAPSSVNDSGRAMMAAVAKYRDDVAGSITTGGTSTAYTITTNQSFDTLARLSNNIVAFKPHATNGATCTLNADGLGAKPLRPSPGIEFGNGSLVLGTPYMAVYNNSSSEWIVFGFFGDPGIPLGAMTEYTGPTTPSSRFVFPIGQAISRSTFASYFALVGTTYGPGDGATTFNVLDIQNAFPRGKSGTNNLGDTGGADTVPILLANLPAANLSVSGIVISPDHSVSSYSNTVQQGTGAATAVGISGVVGVGFSASGSVPLGGSGTALDVKPKFYVVNRILRVL